MKALAVVLAAAASFAASAQETKCAPAPAQLVKKDLEAGTGREVKTGSAVMVGYTGWLYDGCARDLKGAKFDSSDGRATPFSFMVGAGKVIKGWDEGLVGMRERGAKRLLVIPPEKGYGAKGAGGGLIPPNATLVFEVEMFQLVYQPADEARPAPKEPQEKK